ncbi:MAG: hypothetical protein MZV70_04285 [Desulfobacterales bacterium]|nr:hypothetical protein [Desulfobacterales bacterium]
MGKLYPQVSRACLIETRSLKNNQAEITVTQKPGVEEKPYQCANRKGMFEGISKLLTGKYPQHRPPGLHTSRRRLLPVHHHMGIEPSLPSGNGSAAIAALVSLFALPVLIFTLLGHHAFVF